MRRIKGFTLIELLVVIAIAAILIAIATASYSTAQKQARDARRQSDIKDIQVAFEQYYAEIGTYPTGAEAFQNNTLPTDPKNSSSYSWNQSNIGYCICANLETKTGNANAATSTTCVWNNAGSYYCIQNQQ